MDTSLATTITAFQMGLPWHSHTPSMRHYPIRDTGHLVLHRPVMAVPGGYITIHEAGEDFIDWIARMKSEMWETIRNYYCHFLSFCLTNLDIIEFLEVNLHFLICFPIIRNIKRYILEIIYSSQQIFENSHWTFACWVTQKVKSQYPPI